MFNNKKSRNEDYEIKDTKRYRIPIQVDKHYVSTHIEDWDQVDIKHPLFNESYLYSMLPLFKELYFVEKAYIYQNGTLRMEIKGEPRNTFDDLAILVSESKISILRDGRDNYRIMEDKIIEVIIEHTNEIIENMEVGED